MAANVEVVLAMLSRFNCFTLPTTDNIERVLLSCARSELLCKPAHALMHIVIGMNEVHACVWDRVQAACLVLPAKISLFSKSSRPCYFSTICHQLLCSRVRYKNRVLWHLGAGEATWCKHMH